MTDDTQIIVGVGAIIFLGVLAGTFLDILSIRAAYFGLGAGGLGLILWVVFKRQYLQHLFDSFDQPADQTLDTSREISKLWDDLQDWEQQDPRNTELVWEQLNTYVKFTALQSFDGDVFYFYSIITPVKGRNRQLHIGVEAQTGYVVHHAPVRFKQEVTRDPFDYIPIVKDLRESRKSSKQMMRYMKNASAGQLPRSYGNIDQSMLPGQAEAGEDE
ncbi:hypothetical protein [Halomontanus rarus]|uniref:hypothetical protein n=1 Tax=Halomontanus rarus TaxID=3034020 RepID=UPI001A996669